MKSLPNLKETRTLRAVNMIAANQRPDPAELRLREMALLANQSHCEALNKYKYKRSNKSALKLQTLREERLTSDRLLCSAFVLTRT